MGIKEFFIRKKVTFPLEFRLIDILKPFIGGQVQLETDADTYRGKMLGYCICLSEDKNERIIKIYCEWFIRMRVVFDNADLVSKVFRGSQVYSRGMKYTNLKVCFISFKNQPKKCRVKIFTECGEILRFFLPASSTDMKEESSGEYVSMCTLSEYIKVCTPPRSFNISTK